MLPGSLPLRLHFGALEAMSLSKLGSKLMLVVTSSRTLESSSILQVLVHSFFFVYLDNLCICVVFSVVLCFLYQSHEIKYFVCDD